MRLRSWISDGCWTHTSIPLITPVTSDGRCRTPALPPSTLATFAQRLRRRSSWIARLDHDRHEATWPCPSLPCSSCWMHSKAGEVRGPDPRRRCRMILQALIDAEATASDRRRPLRAHRGPGRPAQRHRAQDADHDQAGDLELRIPKLRAGSFFPSPARAAPPDRSGAVRGGDGGLRARRLDPQGRRPGQGAGRRHRDLQVRGVADLRRPGRGGRRVPRTGAWPSTPFPYVFLDATYCKAARCNRPGRCPRRW